jgi:acetyl-CoA carboxylase carboxyl transferase subunit alpha
VHEPLGGAHTDPEVTASNLREHLIDNLEELHALSLEELQRQRYDKYRRMGRFKDAPAAAAEVPAMETASAPATGSVAQ